MGCALWVVWDQVVGRGLCVVGKIWISHGATEARSSTENSKRESSAHPQRLSASVRIAVYKFSHGAAEARSRTENNKRESSAHPQRLSASVRIAVCKFSHGATESHREKQKESSAYPRRLSDSVRISVYKRTTHDTRPTRWPHMTRDTQRSRRRTPRKLLLGV
eukprot:TRINITY_DN10724_c0_g1_i1.p2 TRINITY_DN10724_c0_g1~~TRINITY_DN10724_c0_g1_i1.p2  ORF type:complete len:163 (-),score=4.83 TRINITY_DN10724_c0_g1_i1:107-595(-)